MKTFKRNDYVTVIDNETGKEVSGYLKEYTPDKIVIHTPLTFDAKKVRFKGVFRK